MEKEVANRVFEIKDLINKHQVAIDNLYDIQRDIYLKKEVLHPVSSKRFDVSVFFELSDIKEIIKQKEDRIKKLEKELENL